MQKQPILGWAWPLQEHLSGVRMGLLQVVAKPAAVTTASFKLKLQTEGNLESDFLKAQRTLGHTDCGREWQRREGR